MICYFLYTFHRSDRDEGVMESLPAGGPAFAVFDGITFSLDESQPDPSFSFVPVDSQGHVTAIVEVQSGSERRTSFLHACAVGSMLHPCVRR